MSGMKKWQHLKIPFTEIKDATNNFQKCIGKGGYGMVYEGELTIDGQHTKIAVKRLNEHLGQGLKEFLTEIQLLSGQRHENLISLLGYCDEGKEKIIVYEYAKRGSLDRYIRRSGPTSLTWIQRLKICVDAARGLDHLHNHVGEHQTVIHRDIKSANILLDQNWVAKISDLGLSKLSLAGLDRSAVISHACGTPGYCEPEYVQSGIVKKESDVYSFGMVLFEVLCGRLCIVKDDDGFLLSGPLAKYFYENEKMDDIIDPRIRERMSLYAMRLFSSIAYECLHDDREQRPSMDVVTKEIEEALKIQEEHESEMEQKLEGLNMVVFDSEEYWGLKLPKNIEDEIKKLDSSPVYSTKKELFSLLRKGFFFDNGHRFFSINNDGMKCEMITADKFLKWKSRSITRYNSRGGRGGRGGRGQRSSVMGQYPHTEALNVRCQIRTSMLSPGIMYAANLIFSFGLWSESSVHVNSSRWVWIKWQCQDLCASYAHFAQQIEDTDKYSRTTTFKTTLWHFVNNDKNAYFEMDLNRILGAGEDDIYYILILGIEFQPIKKEMEKEDDESEDVLISKEEDVDWEKNMPSDCQRIIDRSDTHLEYSTKKELYFLLCEGILIDNGVMWFSLCKSSGGKCLMLSAKWMLRDHDSKYELLKRQSLSESRFKEMVRLQNGQTYGFRCIYDSDLSSSWSEYSCYLVFKFIDGHTTPPHDTCVLKIEFNEPRDTYAHLKLCEPINTPIIRPTKNNRIRNSTNIPKVKDPLVPKGCIDGNSNNFMEQRNDGWMEVFLFDKLRLRSSYHRRLLNLSCVKGDLSRVIVQGIEFRPMKKDVPIVNKKKYSRIFARRAETRPVEPR